MTNYAGEASAVLAGHGAAGTRIAESLRAAILAGQYGPGARIRQDELAELHGASRLPVREALRMLEGEGLVKLIANTGAWVSSLTLGECEELYQMRERIEPLLLRYNVPLLDEQQIAELVVLADQIEQAADIEDFIRLDRQFHLASYAVAHTSVLGETVLQLWNRTQHYRRAFLKVFRRDEDPSVYLEHQLLIQAIRRRDQDEAERVLLGHIRRTRLELAKHPEVFSG